MRLAALLPPQPYDRLGTAAGWIAVPRTSSPAPGRSGGGVGNAARSFGKPKLVTVAGGDLRLQGSTGSKTGG